MNCIIVDDEPLARKAIEKLVHQTENLEVIASFNGAEATKAFLATNAIDLVFLDIQMPGKNGFELLSSIEGKSPEVIFTTAYDEYAIKAFEFNALDYLLKPIDSERLKDTIHRIEENQSLPESSVPSHERVEKVLGESDQVFVKDGEKCWFVKLGKIRLFESMGNYVRLHFDDQKPLVLKSLNNLEERLDPNTYFRANRKHIINLHWIEKIEPWFSGGLLVTLQGGDKIEISRRQAIRFKELMSL